MNSSKTSTASRTRKTFGVVFGQSRFRPVAVFIILATLASAGYSATSSAGSLNKILFGMYSDPASKAEAGWGEMRAVAAGATLASPAADSTSLLAARKGHTATALDGGKVLIVGGDVMGTAEVFDMASATSVVTGGLSTPRFDHTATKLSDGRVIVIGGRSGGTAVNTTEIYNPATGSFEAGPTLGVARAGHSATLLSNGTILVAGGDEGGSAEIFNPAAEANDRGTVSTIGMGTRSMHSAALMHDGRRVLVVGGRDAVSNALATAEIFDPAASAFSPVGNSLKVARVRAHLRVLFDGKVQIIGGSDDGSMEVYDPAVDTVGAYAHVLPESDPCVGLYGHVMSSQTRAALFHNGQTDALLDRTAHTLTESSGATQALAAGGVNTGGVVLDSFSVLNSSAASISTDKLDYRPGEEASITGRGFQPGETVRVKIHEDPHTPQERGFDITADSDGSFSGKYLVQEYDLDMKFIVGARGLTSGRTAQTTFTDAAGWSLAITPTSVASSSTTTFILTAKSTSTTSNASDRIFCITVTIPAQFTPVGSPSFVSGDRTWSVSRSGQVITAIPNSSNQELRSNEQILFSQSATAPASSAGSPFTWTGSARNTNCSGTAFPAPTGGQPTVAIANNAASTALTVDPASGTYGGTVNLSATLQTPNLGGTGVSGKTVNFTLNGNSVGSAVTNASGVAALSNVNLSSINAGSYPTGVQASFAGDPSFAGSGGSNSLTVTKATPTITWSNPADITYGTPLGATQLNATASVAGSFTYTQATGTVLGAGTQSLHVDFTPTDTANYSSASKDVSINVTKAALAVKADDKTKTYGGAAVAFSVSYAGFVNGDGPSSLGGTLAFNFTDTTTTAAGTHTITPSSLTSSDYEIAFQNGTLTVNKAALAIKADDKTKTYDGATFSAFTSTITGFVNSETESGLRGSGALSGSAGYTGTATTAVNYNATPYTITPTAGTLTATNYDFPAANFANGGLTINKRAATWTTNNSGKTYGDVDPTPLTTGSGSNFVAGDGVSATYTRAAGETVAGGPYHITATLNSTVTGALDNYDVTNAGADFAISKRDATWTTNPNSKTYGDSDPAPLTTGSGGNFVAGDGVTASYSRAAGETVAGGPYHITATLNSSVAGALDNYNVTNTGANFSVSKRSATWTTNPGGKTYGEADPTPLTTGSGSNFVVSDGVTASYIRVPGETVAGGPYHVTATLSATVTGALDNYDVTNVGADFSIAKRDATWTTNNNSKTYGDADPLPLTTGSGNFLAADGVSATYTRVAGETVAGGPYHITATLNSSVAGALDNYTVTNDGASFSISKRDATWTTSSNSKTYGDADPTPLTAGSGDFLSADGVSASYSRAAGESVAGGPYHITATLSAAVAGALDNYNITNAGASFSISKRNATWTTNPNSKTYGDADPLPLTTGSGDFLSADGVSATYTRAAGETVAGGPYHITATLGAAVSGALDNYNVTNSGANFSVTKRSATWTTNASGKTYGEADPTPLTTGSGDFLAADGVSATYSRAAGETVAGGPYAITATLSATVSGALENYNVTNTGASFSISKRDATWTTNNNSKTYGDADPNPLTTGSGNFLAADGVSATYARVAGETVAGGPYHITATLSATVAGALDNYNVTNEGASFSISKRSATWTTNPSGKTYGDGDPSPLTTGSGSNFLSGDGVSATYGRPAGETVAGGPYHITATLNTSVAGALDNYDITNAGANFSISKRDATWTTNDSGKTYGDGDPTPLTTGSGTNFVAGDGVTAVYTRAAGETVDGGPYHITASLSSAVAGALDNYNITNAGANFNIAKRSATWTTNPNSKTYGDGDSTPLTTGSGTNFVAADGVSATYSRVAGETVTGGPYHITAALSANVAGALDNYDITNNGASFNIAKRNATWTTNPGGKTYGDSDPTPLTSGSGSNFVVADGVSATYNRAAGETVAGGPYQITAMLSSSVAGALDNYDITNNGANFVISKRNATWATNDSGKTYGDADPTPLTTGSSDFLAADGVSASYSRAAGETVAGGPYQITATLSATAAGALDNYNITNAGAYFSIGKRDATWTTNPGGKTYGDSDPTPLTTGTASNFVAADGVSATYSRVAGETVAGGPYQISATLSATVASALDNYNITNAGASFSVSKRSATWATNDSGKTYGDADPTPLTTGSGTNFVPADGVSASYSRTLGETVAGGPYHITATLGATAAGALDNYEITNAGASFAIGKRGLIVTPADKNKTYGDTFAAFTGTVTGVVNGDGITASYQSAGAAAGAAVGAYGITAVLNDPNDKLGNYAVTLNAGTLTVDRALLTVAADNKQKIQGGQNPPLTATITGFKNGETLATSGVTGQPALSTTANVDSPPALYPIAAALGTLAAANYNFAFADGVLTVTPNAAPVIQTVSANIDPVRLGTLATVTATFTDADVLESAPYTATINWGDGTTTTQTSVEPVTVTAPPLTPGATGSFSGSHKYAVAGVYTITVTVSDKIPGTDTETYDYIVVYDPTGGFVTGGGWINSPLGAYSADPSLTGKANFGFVSKYQKGATVPTGETEFQFKAGGLNFHSTVYEWLTIAGARAQYKGSGRINGAGDYGFMLTAIDGQINGGGGTDKFRIKIWNKATGAIVYDNQLGDSDETSTPVKTVIGGGSIVIHSK